MLTHTKDKDYDGKNISELFIHGEPQIIIRKVQDRYVLIAEHVDGITNRKWDIKELVSKGILPYNDASVSL
jgi:hypothetical protein